MMWRPHSLLRAHLVCLFVCCTTSTTLEFKAICAETTSFVAPVFAATLSWGMGLKVVERCIFEFGEC